MLTSLQDLSVLLVKVYGQVKSLKEYFIVGPYLHMITWMISTKE